MSTGMSEIFQEIKEKNRLTRMRLGQDAPDIQPLKSRPDVRVAIVPLTSREDMQAWTAAASVELPDNAYAIEVRDRVLKNHILYHAIRRPDNVEEKVFPSVEALEQELEEIDINFLTERYQLLKSDSSPAMDGLTDEQVDELKKAWLTIDLNALSGRSWELAKALLLEISLLSRMGRSFGLSSTSSLTGKTESNESTPGVPQS